MAPALAPPLAFDSIAFFDSRLVRNLGGGTTRCSFERGCIKVVNTIEMASHPLCGHCDKFRCRSHKCWQKFGKSPLHTMAHVTTTLVPPLLLTPLSISFTAPSMIILSRDEYYRAMRGASRDKQFTFHTMPLPLVQVLPI